METFQNFNVCNDFVGAKHGLLRVHYLLFFCACIHNMRLYTLTILYLRVSSNKHSTFDLLKHIIYIDIYIMCQHITLWNFSFLKDQ
jgi:hypothetical protein